MFITRDAIKVVPDESTRCGSLVLMKLVIVTEIVRMKLVYENNKLFYKEGKSYKKTINSIN